MEQARLALEEAFGVKRRIEIEVCEVEVVAQLVEQRTQKGLEGDDASALRGAHPDPDARTARSRKRVETLELATRIVRPHLEHLERDGRNRKGCRHAADKPCGRVDERSF